MNLAPVAWRIWTVRRTPASASRVHSDAVMSAMQTEEAAEAMAYDGVLPETLVILVEA